ncbi:MAG: hypothetical protein ACOX1X_05150 [Dethiobacteria bacterium]|jgi:hypothetical protein
MTTFYIIHLILGIWLAIVNFTPVMASSSLASNNIIIGVIIALYNAYYLFARKNVEAEQS